jgi:hypothetical protein
VQDFLFKYFNSAGELRVDYEWGDDIWSVYPVGPMFDVAKDGSPRNYYSTIHTTQPGSSMSFSYWGGEVSWHGPSHTRATPNVTIAVDGQKLHPMLQDKTAVASTGKLELGYHTVNLTLNSGELTLDRITIQHYAHISNM